MGQNGSGKSTIIKLINETLRPEDAKSLCDRRKYTVDADHANGLQRAHHWIFFAKATAVMIWNQSQHTNS
jgi:ABC-type cobalamin/Fe3+-siderophores transport system ATPase subunit